MKSERAILIPNQQIFALTPCSYFIWPRCGVLLRFTDYDWPLVSSNSSVLLLIEASLLSGEATNTNFIVF